MKPVMNLVVALTLLVAPRMVGAADIIQALPGRSLPQGKAIKSTRGVNIERKIRNEQSAFCVRADVYVADEDGNRIRPCKNRVFTEGECMGIRVQSEKDGYLYLLYKQADGSERCLFPNKHDQDNRIKAKTEVRIPTSQSRFRLRIAPPFGRELLVVLVTQRPLPASSFGAQSFTNDKDVCARIDLDTVISKGVEIELRQTPDNWAEHSIEITTVPANHSQPPGQIAKRRLGLFIGINRYAASDQLTLKACVNDAKMMATVMQKFGDLDGAGLLLDEQATRRNIEKAFDELKMKSKPGDEIFIFWSGHGGTCADTAGDEVDGKDEYLVPHDVDLQNLQETVVMDDLFGRWIQDLDGRRVVVILDACYSGGQFGRQVPEGKKTPDGSDGDAKAAKSSQSGSFDALLRDVVGQKNVGETGAWVFLGDEISRIKDIGQDDAAVLCSSSEEQISVERRDGKLSAMTYFLLKYVVEEGSPPVTLRSAYDYLKTEVPKYVEENFPGRRQTPLLRGTGFDVLLRQQ